MSLVTLENVGKTYFTGEIPVPALRDINLSLEAGTFISFVGPSGSGKTTLLNLIGCLDKPTKGELFISGVEINLMNRKESAHFRGDNIGFIFQNFNLIPVLTVYENVEYPLIMVQNVPREKRKHKILTLLERVGMTEHKNKLPSQLSGGQKQRVSIARALVSQPKLVLADEPTANLDHGTAYMVIKLMHDMKKEFNTTFIFATHDPKIVGEAEVIHTIEDGVVVDSRENKSFAGGK